MRRTPIQLTRRGVIAAGAAFAGGAVSGLRAAAPVTEPLFDAHSHLVSPDTVRYPQVVSDYPPQTFRQFGTARPLPEAEAMIGWMREAGVEALAAVQKRGTYGLDNRYILDSAARHPDLFLPIVILDAEDDATPATAAALAARGVVAVRLTGSMAPGGGFPWLASDKALRLWAAAERSGFAIEIMTMPFGHPPQALSAYGELARRFPGVRIVIDHLNWPDAQGAPDFGLEAAKAALGPHANLFFKFTTLNIDKLDDARLSPAAFLAHAVATFGADRIMWGTDMGNSPGTYAELVARGRAAGASLSPAARRAAFHDTARAVFARRGR